MPGFNAGGGGIASTADPYYKGAYIDLPTLTSSVTSPVLGDYAYATGIRFDWSGSTWVNDQSNSVVTVANQAAMLALPNPVPGTFTLARRTDTNTLAFCVASPASLLSNWIALPDQSSVEQTVLIMGAAVNAGMPVRIGSDSKGYPAIAASIAPVMGPPFNPDYGGVQGLLGFASATTAIGLPCLISFVSFALSDWSGVLKTGSVSLAPGTKYYLSQTVAGQLATVSALDVTTPGLVIQGIGIALDTQTLVWQPSQLLQ